MPKVFDKFLTKEQLQNLETHVGAKSLALKEHEQLLVDEMKKGTKKGAFHTITRHGPQTGWESQLVRLATGRTPDQPDDQAGIKTLGQGWKTIDQYGTRTGGMRYAAANTVGAFLSPETETTALTIAKGKASRIQPYDFAEVVSKTGQKSYTPFDYIELVVRGPYSLAGVSFYRPKDKDPLTEKEVVEVIQAFVYQARIPTDYNLVRDTWEETKKAIEEMGGEDELHPGTRLWVKKSYRLLFPSMDSMLSYLDVEAQWMKNVKVVYKRVTAGWALHTAYCVNDPLGGGPTVKTGKWTGNLKKKDGTVALVDPNSL